MNQTHNIYVIGAQSTGKTTLARALLQRLQDQPATSGIENWIWPTLIAEVARNVMRRNGFQTKETFASAERVIELQRLILEAQLEAQQSTTGWFISDRSGLDPLVYAREHVGNAAADELEATSTWAELRKDMQHGLVAVCEPNMAWVKADGFRYMPSMQDFERYWKTLHATFVRRLEALEIPYILVPAAVEEVSERVDLVLQAWSSRAS